MSQSPEKNVPLLHSAEVGTRTVAGLCNVAVERYIRVSVRTVYSVLVHCSVTRPYAGFRNPNRMAPDQTVREGENDCFIWSENLLAQVTVYYIYSAAFN